MRRAIDPPQLPGLTYSKVLGSGGFSDVFLYEQELPRRKVAVKVLLTDELTEQTRASFVAEANLMAQLSAHPYIVTIYNADTAGDGRPYFVMEYCSGPSLADQFKSKPLTVTDALRVGVRISSAVATAHAAGILHRDIKPANVLTNDYGWPALTDFGISSALEEELPLHDTTTGTSVADTSSTSSQSTGMSIPWSAPEMFSDDPQPDVRSDVFSLAATIYTLLAGHTPFEVKGRGNGALDLIGRIERGAVTPMPRSDIPRTLTAVLAKGMATDRTERFSTVIEFGRALQRVEMELGFAPTPLDVPNLTIDEEDRAESDPDVEETRARGVVTIDAQPIAPAAAASTIAPPPSAPVGAPPTATPSEGLPEVTVVRQKPTVAAPVAAPPAAQPQEAPAPGVSEEPAADRPPRRRLPVIFAGIGGILVVAAIVVAVVFSGTLTQEPTSVETPGGGGPAAVADVIQSPEVSSAKANAKKTVVTFTVVNPDSAENDVFRWYLLSNPGETTVVREQDTAQIEVKNSTAGAQVCIGIVIQRAGKLSAPTEECYP
jgi:eukaryotic-like serine/threonine-protein kinase